MILDSNQNSKKHLELIKWQFDKIVLYLVT